MRALSLDSKCSTYSLPRIRLSPQLVGFSEDQKQARGMQRPLGDGALNVMPHGRINTQKAGKLLSSVRLHHRKSHPYAETRALDESATR